MPQSSEERKATQRAYYLKNRDKFLARNKAYYEQNKDRFYINNRNYYLNNLGRVRKYNRNSYLSRTHKLTLEEFEALLSQQGNVCAICGTDTPGGGRAVFSVDHDHETGQIRGLLCHGCNVGLGHFLDDPQLLLKAADYLLEARKLREEAA